MAVRITLKRSSIPNKRPSSQILDPGELALNTNALTPGLFFEAENNSVVKVGPTSVGITSPVISPSLGESFFNTVTAELEIGAIDEESASALWRKVTTPFLGGTNGYVVFVAPEFPTASDSVLNNGQASPFATLNRAIIEITKLSIATNNESDTSRNERYTIICAPGILPIYNGPGRPLQSPNNDDAVPEFDVDFEAKLPSQPSVLNLQQFNPQTGGLLVPRGTTIIGMDYRKVQVRPSYVPSVQNPSTQEGVNQPISSILKWTGDSLLESFTFRDKRSLVTIVDFQSDAAGSGVFVSARPHCFGYNDKITFEYAPGTSQVTSSGNVAALSGEYYVYPIGTHTFLLSSVSMVLEPNFIERSQLPVTPQGIGYLATCEWEGRTHNRLRAVLPATLTELNEFYIKVQKAFPVFFNGKTNQAETVNPGETQIVAPVPSGIEQSLISDSTDHASPYLLNVGLRSNFGMCGLVQDGSLVTGFRSALCSSFTCISLQNDPIAYEVYATVPDPEFQKLSTNWYPLQYATWASLPTATRPNFVKDVTREQQMEFLNLTDLVNIRYAYSTLKDDRGRSYGVSNPDRDFRHFGIRSSNSAFIQVDSSWTVGPAVGFWSFNGGFLSAQNCASNFGTQALRSEGFAGIGSAITEGFSDPADRGFAFAGIRLPIKVTAADTSSSIRLELGAGVVSVLNFSADEQHILLGRGFRPINILPFALTPGTGIYVVNGTEEYRAFFVEDGSAPVVFENTGETTLRVRRIDSSFPTGTLASLTSMADWGSPFIKRWSDPRTLSESSYSLIVNTSNTDHRIPQPGAILRLDQFSAGASKLLRPGVQFDPGSSGGWGRVFQVALSQTSYDGDSPQLNEVLLNRSISNSYYVSLDMVDTSRPWLQDLNHAHGTYTTYNNRNWYAASNDDWDGIYYVGAGTPTDESLKLNPTEFESPWAISSCSENLELVKDSYQGEYAPDPLYDLYEETGQYFRGDQPALSNYSFELAVNIDNGSPNFGFLEYTIPLTDSATTSTEPLAPEEVELTVEDAEKFPSPLKQFVVVALTSDLLTTEYCQVLKIDLATKTLTLKRGLYDSGADEDFPTGTTVTLQAPNSFVNPKDYDFDWAPSKAAMIRFLTVMGYSAGGINSLLRPEGRSNRIVEVSNITLVPEEGYAIATGPFPLEFNAPSRIEASSHTFNNVGRLTYSKGLPKYLGNEIPTKQYYDFLSTEIWGGSVNVTSTDNKGAVPLSGEFTEIETGRPYGTFSSIIGDSGRTQSVDSSGSSGGGGGGGGVRAVFTQNGIAGGPITGEGTISLVPPTGGDLGGVRDGVGVTISGSGTISLDIATPTQLGGVKVGEGLETGPDGTMGLALPQPGKLSGVKAGKNITIDPDGTINAADSSIAIAAIDNISGKFDGNSTDFNLRVNGQPLEITSAAQLLLFVGGVIQSSPANFSYGDSAVAFTSPPPRGATFYGIAFVTVLAG